jgi:hypothetical protein
MFKNVYELCSKAPRWPLDKIRIHTPAKETANQRIEISIPLQMANDYGIHAEVRVEVSIDEKDKIFRIRHIKNKNHRGPMVKRNGNAAFVRMVIPKLPGIFPPGLNLLIPKSDCKFNAALYVHFGKHLEQAKMDAAIDKLPKV